jgi:hypothetical protein
MFPYHRRASRKEDSVNTLATYPWQTAYLSAVLETDNVAMPTRIYEALAAIEQRLLSPIETDEHKAIEDAQQGLLTLRAERAGSVSEVNSDFTTSCQSERS